MATGVLSKASTGKSPMPISWAFSPVFSLLLSRSPAAIIRRIISIVIDSINRKAARRITHIGSKSLWAIQPPDAYRNATTAVTLEHRMRRIGTTTNHAVPNKIDRKFG